MTRALLSIVSTGAIILALCGVCMAADANPEQGKPATVTIEQVRPSKVRYRRGEPGTAQITLKNHTNARQTVVVEAEIVQELARITPVKEVEAAVEAGKTSTVELSLEAPDRDYGCALRVRLRQGGEVIDEGVDMFAVADNVWNVAIGADLTIMDMSGRPWQDAQRDIETARAQYFNWWEKMFWAPDDFADLTPTTESWFSGEGGRYEIKKVITDFTPLAKANGIASVTYGKNTAGGPRGWELCRRRPDWFRSDTMARPIGIFDTLGLKRWDEGGKFDGRGWYFLFPDLTRLDTLDWGISEILNSALEMGWDGVRFDGDFNDGPGGSQRRLRASIWEKLPHFVFGYNRSFSAPITDPNSPEPWRDDTFTGGGHYMQEGIRDYMYASNARHKSYRHYWTRESKSADSVRHVGGSYHFIHNLTQWSKTQALYKFMLGTSAGVHPIYGGTAVPPGCANWGRYLTRWSAFVWDMNLRNRPDADAIVQADVPLWHSVKERVVDKKTKNMIVHLIVPPSTDDVRAKEVAVGALAQQVTVRVRIPVNEEVLRAAVICPERPDEALELTLTREGEWSQVIVPEVRLWSLVVLETAGTFVEPSYPEFKPPTPEEVATWVRKSAKRELIRDPLRPDDQPQPERQSTWMKEAENAYYSNGRPVADPDASGGRALLSDGTMPNSTHLSHAIFTNVTPGRYRVTFRAKLAARKTPDGKDVRASFIMYIDFGAGNRQRLASKDVGDYKTPGRYEEFTWEFDFLEGVRIAPSPFWLGQGGGGELFQDWVRVDKLADFPDQVLQQRLEYKPRQDVAPGGKPGLDVLVLNGLYNEQYRIEEALRQFGTLHVTEADAETIPMPRQPGAEPGKDVYMTWAGVAVRDSSVQLQGYPTTYEDLCGYDVVVLINVDVSWLEFEGRARLRDFVEAGGALLVLGGNFSLGQGSFANTFLADMLPVKVSMTKDVEQAGKPLLLKPGDLEQALPWDDKPCLFWRHIVEPKPGAEVLLRAGDEPVLLGQSYGKGRVAVFTGTVLGEPQENELPFWKWSGWPILMNKTIEWLQ